MPATSPHSPPSRCKLDDHDKTTNRQTHTQYLCFKIWQSSSTFNSTIKLGENASLDQGNRFDGSPSDGIRQDGSKFEGEINGESSSKLSQGNSINGHKAEASEDESAES